MKRLNSWILTIILISFCIGVFLPGRTFLVAAQAAINECSQTYDVNQIIGDFGGSVHCYIGQVTTCNSLFMCPTSKLPNLRLRVADNAPTWTSLVYSADPNTFQHDWHIVLKPVVKTDAGTHYATILLEQFINGGWQVEQSLTVVLCVEPEFVIEPLAGCSAGR